MQTKLEVKEIINTIRETIKAQKPEGRPMPEAGRPIKPIPHTNQ